MGLLDKLRRKQEEPPASSPTPWWDDSNKGYFPPREVVEAQAVTPVSTSATQNDSKPAERKRPKAKGSIVYLDPVNFPVQVMGESFHEAGFRALFGAKRKNGVEAIADAELRPEPDNPKDKDAVLVLIDGQAVGYLSRANAQKFKARYGAGTATCRALIRGGWKDGNDEGDYGVKLNLDL